MTAGLSSVVRRRSQADPGGRRLVLWTWAATRIIFAVTALIVASSSGKKLSHVMGHWDVAHFVAIANNGYAVATDVAFFPGLPLLMRAGTMLGVPVLVTGFAVSLVGSLLAVEALRRLGGPWAGVAWLLAPTGVFTFVAYTESVFCAAAFWAWERAKQGQWWQAAGLAAIASSMRVSGLFLIGALFILAFTQGGSWRDKTSRWVTLVVPTAVIGAYATYLHHLTGSWTAWFSAQASGWMRGFHWPWQSLWNSWVSLQPGMYPDHPEWVWIFRGEMLSMFVGVAVTLICLHRRRVAEASWVAVQVLAFSLSFWFQSVNRAVLLWFPLWIIIGGFVQSRLKGHWRWVWLIVVPIAVTIQVTWAWLFYTQRWAS